MIQELLKDYSVITPIVVQWADMDAAQHVNNSVYLTWFESGRIDYFEHLGLTDFTGELTEVGPILGSIQCKYIFPVTYPDTVYVGTRARDLQPDRFVLETAIISERHQRFVTVGSAVIVGYNYKKLKKAEFPEIVHQRIRELEARGQGR